jgi:ribosome production factor 1
MGHKKQHLSSKAHLPFKVGNKQRREGLHIRRKKASDSIQRDERFRRRREEEDDPRLRERRLKENIPLTIERKRIWDQVDNDTGDGLGLSVDVESLRKKQRLEEERGVVEEEGVVSDDPGEEEDSMIDSASEDDIIEPKDTKKANKTRTPTERATSPVHSTTSTNLECTPEALAAKLPTLFSTESAPTPKVLITTGINGTLHKEAESLTNLFPNSVYIPRSSHRYSHRFSVREISSFASNRNFTAVLVLKGMYRSQFCKP